MVGPYPEALDNWGAKDTEKIVDDSEWWRLFTPIFLHGYVWYIWTNTSTMVPYLILEFALIFFLFCLLYNGQIYDM